jgi:hypothetical protein
MGAACPGCVILKSICGRTLLQLLRAVVGTSRRFSRSLCRLCSGTGHVVYLKVPIGSAHRSQEQGRNRIASWVAQTRVCAPQESLQRELRTARIPCISRPCGVNQS